MHRLKKYEDLYDNYINNLLGNVEDKELKEQIILKKIHSLEVERYVLEIADKLDDRYRFLVAVAALFHDIGKFADGDDNHALKAVNIIRQEGILRELDAEDYFMVIKMILFHSEKDIPYFVDNRLALHTRILMDADRLAHVSYAAALAQTNEEAKKNLYKDEEDKIISPKVMKKFIYGKTVKRSKLDNMTEIQANVMVTVIKQLNYTKSLKIVREEQLLERIYSTIPQTTQTKLVFEMCVKAVDRRLNNV